MASFPNQNNSTRKVTTTTKTTFTDQKSTCDPRSATFVSLDVSSSMRGAPIEEAIGSLDNLANMMCKTNKNAHMEVSVFGGAHAPGGKVVMKRRPGFAIDFDILKNNIMENFGGNTPMYDAVKATLDKIKSDYDQGKLTSSMRKNVIIINDGKDNASAPRSLQALNLRLTHPGVPNLNVYFLAVAGADVTPMNYLAAGKKHVHVIDERGADVSTIKRTLCCILVFLYSCCVFLISIGL